MAFEKITDTSLANKGVTGLPDVPGLTTAEMQAKFDELSRDVIIPKFNEIVDGLNGDEVGLSSQIENPETKKKDVIQNVVNAIYQIVKENSDKRHGHENKETLDKVTAELYDSINALVSMFNGISAVDKNVTADDTKIPTSGAIVNYVTALGAGDMQKAIYDKNNTGIVDDAEKLGGVAPEEYLQKASLPDATVAFEEAETRSNISTGEKVSTVFGKIKKFFADLTAPAFAQMITTKEDLLATKVTGYVPDAKAVADTYTELNRNLVKYNEETDSLDVFFNGEIAGSFPCGFQALDLYNYGDECVDVTGGWTIFNSHVNATFTKTANGMYLKTTGDGVYLNIKTANTIDFSKYSKLCIETSDCKLVRSQPWMLYVKCGGSTYDIVKRVSEYRTETIDLPDTMKFAITGNNETNVTITVNNGGAYADSVTEITIHRIYLIK